MKVWHDDNKLFIALCPKEPIIESLMTICSNTPINFGKIEGIGAVKNPILGYFNMETKTYEKREFKGEFELVSLTGNVTLKNNLPLIHCHCMISGDDLVCYGGHLFEAEVSITAEIWIDASEGSVSRNLNKNTGLYLCI